MARKDYYLVLGHLAPGITARDPQAFRDLARRHHPDRAGPTGTPMFREVVEAYRVLSDPQRHRDYDAALGSPVRIRTSVGGSRARRTPADTDPRAGSDLGDAFGP